jgi:hypothetical protein
MSPDVERLVGRTVMDKTFRDNLMADPEKTVQQAGLSLSKEELERLKTAVAKTKSQMTTAQLDQAVVQYKDGLW